MVFINFFKLLKKFSINRFYIKNNNITFDQLTIFFSLLSIFFLSMSPNTHGDSLGYHFVVAKSILYNGNYPLDITHIHTLLAGSGELLISIGMLLDLNSLEVWCSIQVCLAYLVFSKEPTTIKNIFFFY